MIKMPGIKNYPKNINLVKFLNDRYYLNYKGPYTHIISITNRCNVKCRYCIANARTYGKSMNSQTACSIIDFIFSIPLEGYYIEFTGGEPFENFKVLNSAIDYAKKQSKKYRKEIHFSIVSNLNRLTNEHIKFILKNKITICTSIDGPYKIHNLIRPDSYKNTVENIKKLIYYYNSRLIEKPNVITTLTRKSLNYYKEIIDEYVNLGINRVQLGFIEPYGRAKNKWKELGYNYNDYLSFYRSAINYIIDLNLKKNILIYEKGLYLLIYDIFKNKKPVQRSIDIYHRLAYDINGNIYPSDEARIIGENGDDTFLIGNVKKTNFKEILLNKKTQNFMLSNFQELYQPMCHRCKYVYYCKIGTYYNYITQNSLYGNIIKSDRCKIFKGIFEFLFELIKSKSNLKVFKNWLNRVR